MSSINLDLCNLLNDAAGIIRRQSVLLTMHGIETEDGQLESDEFEVLGRIHSMIGGDENRCVCCGEVIPEGMQVCPTCLDREPPERKVRQARFGDAWPWRLLKRRR